jgi:hypothetical protein
MHLVSSRMAELNQNLGFIWTGQEISAEFLVSKERSFVEHSGLGIGKAWKLDMRVTPAEEKHSGASTFK